MQGYTIIVEMLKWGFTVGGGAVLLFGGFRLFQSFGENGTGNDRVAGIMMALGGIAIVALGQNISMLFPAPPSF